MREINTLIDLINHDQPTKMKKALLPSGISNFHKLITHRDAEGNPYLFVDKSLLIKEFINAGDEIALITRPRRFGKTLTLSMLQHFLAPEVNEIPTKGLFDGLKISKHPEIMSHQGRYPVIFLTLKEVRGKNFKEAFARMQEVMKEVFQNHRYLLNSDIAEEDRAVFKRVLNKEASQPEYENALKELSKLLCKHTGSQVIILLDEYDTPINDAYLHGNYEDCRSLLSTMFSKPSKETTLSIRR